MVGIKEFALNACIKFNVKVLPYKLAGSIDLHVSHMDQNSEESDFHPTHHPMQQQVSTFSFLIHM